MPEIRRTKTNEIEFMNFGMKSMEKYWEWENGNKKIKLRINIPSHSAMVPYTPPFSLNSPHQTIQQEAKSKIPNPRSRSPLLKIKPHHQTAAKLATFSKQATYSNERSHKRRSMFKIDENAWDIDRNLRITDRLEVFRPLRDALRRKQKRFPGDEWWFPVDDGGFRAVTKGKRSGKRKTDGWRENRKGEEGRGLEKWKRSLRG